MTKLLFALIATIAMSACSRTVTHPSPTQPGGAASPWRHVPAYGIVATIDLTLNPDIERKMYARSNTKVTEIKGSHCVYISQPVACANVIMQAATKKTFPLISKYCTGFFAKAGIDHDKIKWKK